MFGRLIKTKSYNVFDYKPRYYDERKERIKKLEEKYSNPENHLEENNYATYDFSRTNLRKSWKRTKSPASNRKSSIRLALIITILVGIAAYILDFHHLF